MLTTKEMKRLGQRLIDLANKIEGDKTIITEMTCGSGMVYRAQRRDLFSMLKKPTTESRVIAKIISLGLAEGKPEAKLLLKKYLQEGDVYYAKTGQIQLV